LVCRNPKYGGDFIRRCRQCVKSAHRLMPRGSELRPIPAGARVLDE
jgi:hypothetical protein